tara:strand:- start:682 stop:909 length:228 start_codon:yes stop_codon:yes gene_type:complete
MKKYNLSRELSNAEVYDLASTLLRQYGQDAAVFASLQAGEKLSNGDMIGYRIWKRLVMLVDGILEKNYLEQNCLH